MVIISQCGEEDGHNDILSWAANCTRHSTGDDE